MIHLQSFVPRMLQAALTAAGVWRIDSGVDAMCRHTAEKNVKLFSDLKV